MKKQKLCKNCNKKITSGSKLGRCKSCENKRRHRLGILNIKGNNNPSIKNRPSHIGELNSMYGKHHSLKTCKIIKEKILKLWRNKMYKEKQLKSIFAGRKFLKNKIEIKLEKLLNYLFPKIYNFVGDGYTFISGFNPDFIDLKHKKIIELYGDYWHNRPEIVKRDKKRLQTYKKYEYKILVVWQHELRSLKKLTKKLYKFNKI